MPCSHVTTPKFGPKFGPLKFNTVPMVMGRLIGRIGVETIQPKVQSDLANCKHLHMQPKFDIIGDGLAIVTCEQSLSL